MLSEQEGEAGAKSRRWSPQGQGRTAHGGPTGQIILVERGNSRGRQLQSVSLDGWERRGELRAARRRNPAQPGQLPEPPSTTRHHPAPGRASPITTETVLRSQSLFGFSRLSPRPRALPAPAFDSPKAKPPRSRGEGAVPEQTPAQHRGNLHHF